MGSRVDKTQDCPEAILCFAFNDRSGLEMSRDPKSFQTNLGWKVVCVFASLALTPNLEKSTRREQTQKAHWIPKTAFQRPSSDMGDFASIFESRLERIASFSNDAVLPSLSVDSLLDALLALYTDCKELSTQTEHVQKFLKKCKAHTFD